MFVILINITLSQHSIYKHAQFIGISFLSDIDIFVNALIFINLDSKLWHKTFKSYEILYAKNWRQLFF